MHLVDWHAQDVISHTRLHALKHNRIDQRLIFGADISSLPPRRRTAM